MQLPRASDFKGLPSRAVIAVPVPDNGLTLYRLVTNNPPEIEDFEPKSEAFGELTGAYELNRLGVSHFLTREDVEAVRKRPGSLVARVTLRPRRRTHVARTGRLHGHVDVWGPLEELLGNAEIVP